MLSRRSGTGCHFSGPTHKDTDELKNLYGHRCNNAGPCCVLSGDTGSTTFSLTLLKEEDILQMAKKRCRKFSLMPMIAGSSQKVNRGFKQTAAGIIYARIYSIVENSPD